MAFIKNRNNGKPKNIPAQIANNVSLMSTDNVLSSANNRSKGIKSPGWYHYEEHIKQSGKIKIIVEPLVVFSGKTTFESLISSNSAPSGASTSNNSIDWDILYSFINNSPSSDLTDEVPEVNGSIVTT